MYLVSTMRSKIQSFAENAPDLNPMINAKVLYEIPKEETLAREWDELVFEMEHPEVFYTYEWALAASEAFSSSIRPLLILIYERTSLLGVACLATALKATDRVFFLGDKTADYCDVVTRPAQKAKVLEKMLHELKRLNISEFVISNLPHTSQTREIIGLVAKRMGYHSVNGSKTVCPRVSLAEADERIAVKDSVNRKQSAQRHLAALTKIGDIDISHLRNWSEISRDLPCFFHQHIARFLATRRVSPFIKDERRLFLVKLAELLSAKGWMALSRLSVGKRGVAWNFGFEFGDKWFWYMPTFDIEYERFWPGELLLKSVLEQAVNSPHISTVDLGLGNEFYKKRFANTEEHICQMTLTDSAIRYVQVMSRAFVVKMIKRSASTEKVARKVAVQLMDAYHLVGRGGVLRVAAKGMKWCVRMIWQKNQFIFLEWGGGADEQKKKTNTSSAALKILDWQILAKAALSYENDKEALDYLTRAGKRLGRKEAQGFVLTAEDNIPVHFCWVVKFGGFFFEELHGTLKPPSEHSVIVFDCWTPESSRRRGFYTKALELVAGHFSYLGKTPWILSSSKNVPSLRGISRAGFKPKFTAISLKFLFWRWVWKTRASADNMVLNLSGN